MATRPRSSGLGGVLRQMRGSAVVTPEQQRLLKSAAQEVLESARQATPSFDPEMAAGWTLQEEGGAGTPRYVVSVVNNSSRAQTPLSYKAGPYTTASGQPYTLLDVYEYGARQGYTIAPRWEPALLFFWHKMGRPWIPREGQATTHPGLPPYETVSIPKRKAEQMIAVLRGAIGPGFFATVGGQRV